jgi:lipopolysaccharide transport system permease protein
LFGDVLRDSPILVLTQPNFVKKVIFPLEILPVISLLTALIHALISLSLFILIYGLLHLSLPWTIIYLPFVFIPIMLIALGISFFLSATGVYFRDLGHFMGHIVTVLIFTSPVFFSLERMPKIMQKAMIVNPIAYLLENARFVMVYNKSPEWLLLGLYTVISLLFTKLGLVISKNSKMFAGVI